MRNCYTYHIFHEATGSHYYGSRYAKGCDPADLWVTYFTSSKIIAKLREEYGNDSFKVEIRKTFGDNPVAAQQWEKKVLSKLNVLNRDNWLNANIGGICNLTADQQAAKGYKISQTAKIRPRVAWNKGLKGIYSVEQRMKLSINAKERGFGYNNLGRVFTEAHRDKIRSNRLGKKMSPESIAKRTETRKRNRELNGH